MKRRETKKIFKWGAYSQTVLIPKAWFQEIGLKEGDDVEMTMVDGMIILRNSSRLTAKEITQRVEKRLEKSLQEVSKDYPEAEITVKVTPRS